MCTSLGTASPHGIGGAKVATHLPRAIALAPARRQPSGPRASPGLQEANMGGDRGKGWKRRPPPPTSATRRGAQSRAALQVQREQQQHNEGPAGTKDEQAQALEQRAARRPAMRAQKARAK